MKRTINKMLFCLLLTGCFTACSKYLDVVPDNIATIDNAFSDRYNAMKFLATCYWGIPKSAGWNENPGMLGAFEITMNKDKRTNGGMQAALGENSATQSLINYWSSKGNFIRSLYAGIRDCNTFLERIDEVQDLNKYEKERMKAEIRVVKAYYHFYLLRYYGPISPLKTNTPVNESTEGVRVFREKVDDSFQYILDLLNEAITSGALPTVIENRATEIGRFTLPVAHFVKAMVWVYWASPLFNGNTDYSGFLTNKGEPFFNQTVDSKRWDSAAAVCRTAMEVCSAAGIRLYQKEDYLAVNAKKTSDTTLTINTLRSAVTQRWNPEIIWGNSSYPADWNYQIAALTRFEQGTSTPSSNTGTLSVPLSTVETFYSNNGVPINEDKTYAYSTRYNSKVGDAAHNLLIAKGETTASLNFDREARFYATLGFDRGRWYGNSYKNYPDNDNEALFPKNRFGEFSSVFNPGEYNATGYWPKKLISMNTTWRDANSVSEETYPYPDMRFANLILLYAEALNESKAAPDGDVYQLVDMIRQRAGLKGVVESWIGYSNQPMKPTTKAGMREIIQQERKIELACESSYYWDSRRWKTAVKEQNRVIQGWNVYATTAEEYYTVTTLYTQKFTLRDYFAPIPMDDIIKNPQLVQNPGW